MTQLLTILQDRQCGSCSLCCKLLPIVKNDLFDFEKPAGVWCSHFKQGIGCSIHAIRPQGCRNYQCEWLRGNLSAELKPDVVNFIVEQRHVENLAYMLIVWDSAYTIPTTLEAYLLENNGKQRMLIYGLPIAGQQYIAGLGDTEEERTQDGAKLLDAFKRQGLWYEAPGIAA